MPINTSTKQLDSLHIEGVSLAGIHTSFIIPELEIAIDVAQGLPFNLGAKTFFITHGHLDHAAGIPYVISQKMLNSHNAPVFFTPQEIIAPLERILAEWQSLEQHTYRYEIRSASVDDILWTKGSWAIRSFESVHRVPTRGYTLFERKKKLKSEYAKFSREEILNLKSNSKIEINIHEEKPILSITGDTTIEVFQKSHELKNSKYLIIETTYLDEKRSPEHARKWGHIHLDELIDILPKLHCEKIWITHLSSRYSRKEAESILRSKLPRAEHERVSIF